MTKEAYIDVLNAIEVGNVTLPTISEATGIPEHILAPMLNAMFKFGMLVSTESSVVVRNRDSVDDLIKQIDEESQKIVDVIVENVTRVVKKLDICKEGVVKTALIESGTLETVIVTSVNLALQTMGRYNVGPELISKTTSARMAALILGMDVDTPDDYIQARKLISDLMDGQDKREGTSN